MQQLTKSHVQLCKRPISWKVSEPASDLTGWAQVTHQVFYDTLHEELIMLSRAANGPAHVSISDHRHAKWVECDCGIPDPQVVRMKFSAKRDFLALQVNIREVKVVDIARGRLVAARSCRSHKSRITNIYWCKGEGSEQLFLFVTNTGAELYTLRLQGSTLKHLKTVQHQTRYHWFVNTSNWLLVVDMKHIFSLYHVEPKGLVRKCKFELNCRGTNFNSNNDAYYEQISLVELYGEVMCVYINEQKGKLYILGLNKQDTMTQKYMFELYSPSRYEVSVIDNVLVVHNMIAKLALLFDVLTDPAASIAAPLPIAHEQYEAGAKERGAAEEAEAGGAGASEGGEARDAPGTAAAKAEGAEGPAGVEEEKKGGGGATDDGKKEGNGNKDAGTGDEGGRLSASGASGEGENSLTSDAVRTRAHHAQEHKYEHWSFLPDRYVLDNTALRAKDTNLLWTMHLDLQAIAHSWPSEKRTMLVDFLIKRKEGDAKPILLGVLLELIMDGSPLPAVSRLFNLINGVCYEAHMFAARNRTAGTRSSPGRRAGDTKAPGPQWQGYQVISQDEIVDVVFMPALKKGKARKDVVPYVLEYIRSVTRNFLRVGEKVNRTLVNLLLAEKRYFELHQLLQYHVLLDSKPFALALIALEDEYEAAYQLGLDMMYRLGAFPEMMRVLLRRNQVMQALQLVTHNSTVFREPDLRPRDFLRTALEIGRSATFFTAYRFFQARNQALRGSPVFLPEDGCDAYVQVFERNFRRTQSTSANLLHLNTVVDPDLKSNAPESLVSPTPAVPEASPISAPAPTSSAAGSNQADNSKTLDEDSTPEKRIEQGGDLQTNSSSAEAQKATDQGGESKEEKAALETPEAANQQNSDNASKLETKNSSTGVGSNEIPDPNAETGSNVPKNPSKSPSDSEGKSSGPPKKEGQSGQDCNNENGDQGDSIVEGDRESKAEARILAGGIVAVENNEDDE
mmetsp:Transcript_14140/g.34464  ORF Transcript_14140/g.34464 Transcript_14140/m.34464 type:complete len:963 (-) Transcript_14140:59-2947(-)